MQLFKALNDSEAELWRLPQVVAHTSCLVRSYTHWTGRQLTLSCATPEAEARALFEAPLVVVSHGVGPDPILNYGNQAALQLWEMSWDELTRTPSRLTAEVPNQEERARLLETVSQRGFIDNYCGVRISKTGRRFRIEQATVWNLLDLDGLICGQAAMFKNWRYL